MKGKSRIKFHIFVITPKNFFYLDFKLMTSHVETMSLSLNQKLILHPAPVDKEITVAEGGYMTH